MISSTECGPRRVVQILSGSRTGSTLLKTLLASLPGVTALAGEEEPYVALSGNGYGFHGDDDSVPGGVWNNPRLFRRLLHTELAAADPWPWRLFLQYRGAALARLLDGLPAGGLDPAPGPSWGWLRAMGVAGHYDGCRPDERKPFAEMAWEMPPFVPPRPAPAADPARPDVLLLKAPYNLHRPGAMEACLPGAEFSRVVLLRNPAGTMNGLIDGWHADYGFHKRQVTPDTGNGPWWKFDMPPGWRSVARAPAAVRAWYQWERSAALLADRLDADPGAAVVRFEDLTADPAAELRRLAGLLGLDPGPGVSAGQPPPVVMGTEAPRPGRWRARAAEILPCLRRSAGLIRRLGYADESLWV